MPSPERKQREAISRRGVTRGYGPWIAGLDGGGSKTACLICDREGRVVGSGLGGPINVNFVSDEVASQSLHEALQEARLAAGLSSGTDIAVLAVAGPVPTRLVNDAAKRHFALGELLRVGEGDAALLAAQPWLDIRVGVTVDSGTGSLAMGVNAAGERAGAGGWGALLGDEGSGYWIGEEALRAAVRASDGREKPTVLEGVIGAALGIRDLHELIPLVYRRGLGRREIAALAPAVAQTARDGDAVAREIMHRAAQELALMVRAVIERLHMEQEEFAVVPFGSVFKASDLLLPPFERLVKEIAPRSVIVLPEHEPVIGCLVAGLQHLGIGLSPAVLDNLGGAGQ